jgi:hypothetical protein
MKGRGKRNAVLVRLVGVSQAPGPPLPEPGGLESILDSVKRNEPEAIDQLAKFIGQYDPFKE